MGQWALEWVGCGRKVDVEKDYVAQIECWRNLSADENSNERLESIYKQAIVSAR